MVDWNDYQHGQDNPYQLPGSGPINWDFQQGQMDAIKKTQDARNPLVDPEAVARTNAAAAAEYASGRARPYRPPPKSYVKAAVACVLLGPLGLFYASKKAAFIMIGLLIGIPMLTGTLNDGRVIYQLLEMSIAASIIWSIIAVKAHNRRSSGEAN